MTQHEHTATTQDTEPTAAEPATEPPAPVLLGLPGKPTDTYPTDVLARLEPDAKEIIARYPNSRSALIPLLHLTQSEEGYVTPTGVRFCADQLDLTTAEVNAVATFYSMYRRKPSGDYQVGVCTNTLCAVLGGDAIYSALREHLGVGDQETTDDGKVTLEHIECNAACDYAPVLTVNWEFFDNQTVDSARQLVDALRADERVTPTRGAPLCTFRETARLLAGFPDQRDGANEAAGNGGAPSLVGLRIARGENPPTEQLPTSGTHPSGAAPGTPSGHDAPLPTSASDPANPAPPAGEDSQPGRAEP